MTHEFLNMIASATVLPRMLLIAVLCGLNTSPICGVEPNATENVPRWIWATSHRDAGQEAVLQKVFRVDEAVETAELRTIVDFCDATLILNGRRVAYVENHASPLAADVTSLLRTGENRIEIKSQSDAPAAAINVAIRLSYKDGHETAVVSDASWSAALGADSAGAKRGRAVSFGPLAEHPWGTLAPSKFDATINPFDDYEQWKQAIGAEAGADPAAFRVAPGFEIELLHSATGEEGSWVSMAFDPQGRLVIGREDRGLLRFTLGDDGRPRQVQMINDSLEECRGLLFADGCLLANANNSKSLYRLSYSAASEWPGEPRLLFKTGGGVGHGRNDLTLGPDNMIYAIHGDAVDLPDDLPDRTSPLRHRDWICQANHGFVVRMYAGGLNKEIFAAGLRNPFGIAANEDGEFFTYDADAEFDMGAPWYRPTRVRHLVSGADYGWRAVTKQWPPYFPDVPESPPPTLDIGRGSPTAVKFGTQSNFPKPYRDALFILDWSYGRVLAVHMAPRGASYACRAETFVKGRPLNVTDLDFGPDGAMYLVTGGRKTKSALYRIRYVGQKYEPPPLAAQQIARAKQSAQSRALRHKLEAFHGVQDSGAVEFCWPHLDSPDPWIRHAARVAIEHQPVDEWQSRALGEQRTEAALTSLLALARGGPDDVVAQIVERLNSIRLNDLTVNQKLTALRVYELCLARSGELESGSKDTVAARLDSLLPDADRIVNWTACRLLLQLDAPRALPKAIALLSAARDQKDQLFYVFALRNVRNGWTRQQRETYFSALRNADTYVGGEGMPGFIQKMRAEAVATLSAAERDELATLLEAKSTASAAKLSVADRPFVKEWNVADLADDLPQVARGRDLERGRQMFSIACAQCHRVGATGGAIGPDLSSLAGRFGRYDVLRAIIEPSLVVAEPYRNVEITTTAGKTIVGRVVLAGDFRQPTLRISTDVLNPDATIEIQKQEIVSHTVSSISPMPTGLLNTLSKEEILDLLAFLESGGRSDGR